VSGCIFCKIVEGQIPAKIVHQDDLCVAFEDINPVAPTHLLVVPRRHIATALDLVPSDAAMVGHLHQVAARLARERRIAESGFRTVMNCNAGAGQSVFHIHLHVLGGRPMQWPPG